MQARYTILERLGGGLLGCLRGDLVAGQPGDAVPAEEAARPALAPDEAHREGGAVFHLLRRPDLDVGVDYGLGADLAPVAHDGAFLHGRVGEDDLEVVGGDLADLLLRILDGGGERGHDAGRLAGLVDDEQALEAVDDHQLARREDALLRLEVERVGDHDLPDRRGHRARWYHTEIGIRNPQNREFDRQGRVPETETGVGWSRMSPRCSEVNQPYTSG